MKVADTKESALGAPTKTLMEAMERLVAVHEKIPETKSIEN